MKIVILLIVSLVASYHTNVKSHSHKGMKKHRMQIKKKVKSSQFGNGNIIVAPATESNKKSGVDLEPWHYKLVPPEVMFASKEISKSSPESYNQTPDPDPNNKGCTNQTLQFLKAQGPPEAPPAKQQIYIHDPHAYYDPTEMLKLTPGHAGVYAVPVVMEDNIENDNTKALEAERRRIHHPYNTYYDPEVPSHQYELTGEDNGLNRAFHPYKGDIVTPGRKTVLYDELKEDDWTKDVIMHQLKFTGKQDVPMKQMRAVDMKIQDQHNRRRNWEMRDEVLPKKRDEGVPMKRDEGVPMKSGQ